MNEIVLIIGLLLGNLTVTSYRSVPNQTDSSPYFTSIGKRVHKGGAAISRDLLKRWGGPVDYGDYVLVEGLGIYQINDCMGATKWDKVNHKRVPIRQAVDIWVSSHQEERSIGLTKRKVYLFTRRLYEQKKLQEN